MSASECETVFHQQQPQEEGTQIINLTAVAAAALELNNRHSSVVGQTHTAGGATRWREIIISAVVIINNVDNDDDGRGTGTRETHIANDQTHFMRSRRVACWLLPARI